MEVNKTKTITIAIKVWLDKDYVYCNSAEAVKYVWGSMTSSCDMRRQGLERVTDKNNNFMHYRLPRKLLEERYKDLQLKAERTKNALITIKKVLEDNNNG